MFVSHSPTMAWFPAATLPSFIKLIQDKQLYKKIGHLHDEIQYVQSNEGNSVPRRTNISPMNNETICTIAWQPSLVLGGLGRALTGPYSLRRL
jgi:hypothetical protein